jgi:hypothetical protein
MAVAASVDAEGTTLGLSDEQIIRIAAAMKKRPDAATFDRLALTFAPFPGIVQLLCQ